MCWKIVIDLLITFMFFFRFFKSSKMSVFLTTTDATLNMKSIFLSLTLVSIISKTVSFIIILFNGISKFKTFVQLK